MAQFFDHEKLRVCQEAIRFVEWTKDCLDTAPKGPAARKQLDRASTSIALNIAEGNGKFTGRDRCNFFDIARGSALECAACLDVLVAKGVATPEDVRSGKRMLANTVSMLVGLIKATSRGRVHEEEAAYPPHEDKSDGDYD